MSMSFFVTRKLATIMTQAVIKNYIVCFLGLFYNFDLQFTLGLITDCYYVLSSFVFLSYILYLVFLLS